MDYLYCFEVFSLHQFRVKERELSVTLKDKELFLYTCFDNAFWLILVTQKDFCFTSLALLFNLKKKKSFVFAKSANFKLWIFAKIRPVQVKHLLLFDPQPSRQNHQAVKLS